MYIIGLAFLAQAPVPHMLQRRHGHAADLSETVDISDDGQLSIISLPGERREAMILISLRRLHLPLR